MRGLGSRLLPLLDREQSGQRGNACLHDSCVTMQRSELALPTPLKHGSYPPARTLASPLDPPVAPSRWPPYERFYCNVVYSSFICIRLSQRSNHFFVFVWRGVEMLPCFRDLECEESGRVEMLCNCSICSISLKAIQ